MPSSDHARTDANVVGTCQEIDAGLTRSGFRSVRVSHDRLKELLSYDPETGIFRWVVSTNNFIKVGAPAGNVTASGYVNIQIDGKDYRAHNLAWLYMTGEWPRLEIDHRDVDSANNAWSNLREATRTQQGVNQRTRKDNKLGVKGVCPYRDGKRYVAQIRIGGKTKHLGLFQTIQEAASAYERAAIDAWGEFARTS
jgi:hypothetical protein